MNKLISTSQGMGTKESAFSGDEINRLVTGATKSSDAYRAKLPPLLVDRS